MQRRERPTAPVRLSGTVERRPLGTAQAQVVVGVHRTRRDRQGEHGGAEVEGDTADEVAPERQEEDHPGDDHQGWVVVRQPGDYPARPPWCGCAHGHAVLSVVTSWGTVAPGT